MGFFKNLANLTKNTAMLPVDLAADTLSGGLSMLHTKDGRLLTQSRLENLTDSTNKLIDELDDE